jgi:hypothetical protein
MISINFLVAQQITVSFFIFALVSGGSVVEVGF